MAAKVGGRARPLSGGRFTAAPVAVKLLEAAVGSPGGARVWKVTSFAREHGEVLEDSPHMAGENPLFVTC